MQAGTHGHSAILSKSGNGRQSRLYVRVATPIHVVHASCMGVKYRKCPYKRGENSRCHNYIDDDRATAFLLSHQLKLLANSETTGHTTVFP